MATATLSAKPRTAAALSLAHAEALRRALRIAAVAVIAISVTIGVGYWSVWNFFLKYAPTELKLHGAEIEQLLGSAGWVSNGGQAGPVYLIMHRNCRDCIDYHNEEFPKLQIANVDTRVIPVPQPELDGKPHVTGPERSTIAELWVNRNPKLLQQWLETPEKSWTAEGVRPADGDMARTAVLTAPHAFLTQLSGYLRDNKVDLTYPTLLWKDSKGQWKACACAVRPKYFAVSDPYAFVRRDFGAPSTAPVAKAAAAPDSPAASLSVLPPAPPVDQVLPDDAPASGPAPQL